MMTSVLLPLFFIVVFPGFLFLCAMGLVVEYLDRKLHARLQNRVGPPWYQPFADFVKLVAKEDLIPENADKLMFRAAPLVALASAVTAMLYIPVWGPKAVYSFEGDAVVVLYLLTIPTLCFFLGGWFSASLYATVGAVRTLTQLFAYEVPLFVVVLAPAVMAGTWSLSGISAYYAAHPAYALLNLVGFAVAIIALLGKLEKVPFDIAEAETEIVGGTFTEYSGRLLAFFRLTVDIEAVVASSLLAAVFLPWGLNWGPWVGFALYVVKVLFVVVLMSVLRTVFARLRIDQMLEFCWKWLASSALVQLVISLLANGLVKS